MKESQYLYQIFVNTPSKVLCLRDVPSDLSIIQLKSTIEMKSGIPVEQQELLLSGAILSDESTITETGLRDKNVVRLAFKTKAAETLCEMVLQDDLVGILNTGVQWIELSEANNDEERRRLVTWNENATNRAFVVVCVACVNGMLDLVVNLIKLSAFDVNQVTSYGRSALHFAAIRGSIGCVCVLLDNGIDPAIQDCDGKTAQDIASEYGHIYCKRRIWLYRWSITPTKRKRGSTPEKDNRSNNTQDSRHNSKSEITPVRLPLLGKGIKSSNQEESNEGYRKEENSGLPEVKQQQFENSSCDNISYRSKGLETLDNTVDHISEQKFTGRMDKRTESVRVGTATLAQNYRPMDQNRTSMAQNRTSMEQNRTSMNQNRTSKNYNRTSMVENNTSRELNRTGLKQIGDLEDKAEQSTQTITNDEVNDEFATMLRLVEKYGYMISENSLLKKRAAGTWLSNSLKEEKRPNQIMRIPVVNTVQLEDISKIEQNLQSRSGDSNTNRAQTAKTKETGDTRESTKVPDKMKMGQESLTNGTVEVNKTNSTEEVIEVSSERTGIDELNMRTAESYEANRNPNQQTLNRQNRPISAVEDRVVNRPAMEVDRGREKQIVGRIGIGFERRAENENARASFDQWLEKKEREKKANLAEDGSQVNQSDKRKETNEQAFRKWLQLKRVRHRARSASCVRPLVSENNKEKITRGGLSFESWMTRKRKDQPRSFSLPATNAHTAVSRVFSSGKTHEEWIESKKRQDTEQNKLVENEAKMEGTTRQSGITFDSWMATKQELTQIEKVRQATTQLQQQYHKEMEYQKKLMNPKVKTFEEWQMSKKYEERLQRSIDKRDKNKNKRVKYEEDSKLVFNMWLLNKHLYEMQEEQEQIENARHIWKKKKETLRRVKTN